MMPRQLQAVEKAAALLLLAYPLLMLTVRGGMNGVFILMLLLSILVWAIRLEEMNKEEWRHEWTLYVVSMFGLSIAISISQLWNQTLSAHPYDAASRYWLGIPVFLLLVRLRLTIITVLQFALPVAAIAGFVLSEEIKDGRLGLKTLDLIHFGNFELLLGVMSLVMLNWLKRDKLLLQLLKLLGFVAGAAASLASGERGGWLAIPVFFILFVYFNSSRITFRVFATSVSLMALALGILYFVNDNLHNRTRQLITDVANYKQGYRDSSTGIRWQLYGAALDVFVEHPFVGVGPDGFALQLEPMVKEKKLTPYAAHIGRGEVHNDLLASAAELGIFGLTAMLAIYIIPIRLFWLFTKSPINHVRRTGIMGVFFVSGFMVFGLTANFLNLTLVTAFYSFTIAALLAAGYTKKSC